MITKEDKRLIELKAYGYRYRAIATFLGLNESKVKRSFSELRQKLEAKTNPHLMLRAFQEGILR